MGNEIGKDLREFLYAPSAQDPPADPSVAVNVEEGQPLYDGRSLFLASLGPPSATGPYENDSEDDEDELVDWDEDDDDSDDKLDDEEFDDDDPDDWDDNDLDDDEDDEDDEDWEDDSDLDDDDIDPEDLSEDDNVLE